MVGHRIAGTFVVAALLASCSTSEFAIGRNFPLDAFTARIVRGSSTQADVRSWIGEPASTGYVVDTNGDRFDRWTFYFADGALGNLASTRLRILQVKFNAQGVVQGYEVSQSAE